MPKDALHDIELLIRSRYGLIYVDTPEEDRANVLLRHVADRLGVPLFTWTRSQGLSRADGGDMIYESPDPTKAIQHVIAAQSDEASNASISASSSVPSVYRPHT